MKTIIEIANNFTMKRFKTASDKDGHCDGEFYNLLGDAIHDYTKLKVEQAVEVALRVASEKLSHIVCSTTGERLGSEYILSLLPEIMEELNNGK